MVTGKAASKQANPNSHAGVSTLYTLDAKSGKMVKQGQVIGYVGQTGYATGPHLHYEFLVNGVHQNPRTVSLPKATPIAPKHKQLFAIEATRLFSLLENYKGQMRLAAKQ